MKPTDLVEHPEGGRYREVFRSDVVVTKAGGKNRRALTHIYFSLKSGEVSRFHKVSSDEVWNLYKGEGLRLYTWDGMQSSPDVVILSSESQCFCHVIPAGTWQAAEPISDTVIVGCSVAPGFDFADFELMEANSDEARQLAGIDKAFSKFIS